MDAGNEGQVQAGETLYRALGALGVEVVLDDRPIRVGAKFADADLMGIPYRVTLGRHLERGEVEVQQRATGERWTVPVSDVATELHRCIRADLQPRT